MVLLDVMMPGMDGFEVCRRIKSAPKTMHVPVIMVTALDQASDKVQGLEAGADDFLTKPVDDIALITRVKNLARLKTLNDEMMLRMATGAEIGAPAAAPAWRGAKTESGGRILLVEDHERVGAARAWPCSASMHEVDVEPDLQAALLRLGDKPYDLLIVSLNLAEADGLRLCSQVRSLERTRHLPDHRDGAAGRRGAPAARARHGRERLSDASRRSQRADRARAHADQAQAPLRLSARPARTRASSSPSPTR